MVTSQRSVSEFWADVKNTAERIEKEIAESKEQLKDGKTCYIIACRRKGATVEFGDVMVARIKLAAQRIEEGTVALANDDQIHAFKKKDHAAKAELQRAAIAARTSFVAHVPEVVEEAQVKESKETKK